jgi:hypothetical protein
MRVLKKELWPYRVALDVEETGNDIYEIEVWLGKTMGSFKDRWNAVYGHSGTDFYFRRGQDATLFALKWS